MRVAFDVSSTLGRKTGIGVYTEQLVQALNEFVPQVEPIWLDDNARVDQRTDRRILREQFALPRLAQRAGAEVVHLTGFAAPIRSSVPVVLTVMDLIGVLFPGNFPPAARFYWAHYLPWTLRAPRHIITLSENTKADVIRLTKIPKERISVIPPGIDPRFRGIQDPHAKESIRARLHLPAQFFLFVSTLEPRKGVDTLVSAYSQIATRVQEDLVIVGKQGWFYESLFQLVRGMGLETRVHLTDYVPDEDMAGLYNLATAFVFPSRYEGFGLTVLEAMACGLPVISSNASSLREVVGNAGILVAPGDIEGFAREMEKVATTDGLWRSLSARGLERSRFFSWRKAAEQVSVCYTKAGSPLPRH